MKSKTETPQKERWPTIHTLDIAVAFLLGAVITSYTHQFPEPQTRPLSEIGDPNASDPNDTFIEYNGRKFYETIDGQSVKDYLNNKRKD